MSPRPNVNSKIMFTANENLNILKVVIGELRDFSLNEILGKLRCGKMENSDWSSRGFFRD